MGAEARDEDLVVRPGRVVRAFELVERFSPSGGPGGQHANRAHTRVELRVDLTTSAAFTELERSRLISKLGPVASVVVDDERSQARNRAIARDRLGALLRSALVTPRRRVGTRPTKASQTRRLDAKTRRGATKAGRRRPNTTDD
ncbi:MAG: alternative ribosome rescue aminoacyl-tRNA hydrolase ArfB [Actinomycetes bacterium]